MSKAKAKKLRKRARKVAEDQSDGASKVSTDDSVWYTTEGELRMQNFHALRLELLGPFLFGQNLLCDKALSKWRELEILTSDGSFLSIFFARPKWEDVRLITNVVQAVLKLCESNGQFCRYLLDTSSSSKSDQDDDSLAKVLHLHSNTLKDVPSQKVKLLFSAIRVQVSDFAVRAQQVPVGQLFAQTLADKEKLIAPVKERGNTNFKQLRYRAAIGDYTTAIKLCPYSPVLYCNRALCYLRNEEYWCACIDSYRAVVLKPGWEKAYYRCAEAWGKLGEPEMALIINKEGVRECSDAGDLSRQTTDLQTNKPTTTDVDNEVMFKPSEVKDQSESKKPVPEAKPKIKSKKNKSKERRVGDMKHKTTKPTPFVDFEPLQYPQIDGHLTCKALRNLCKEVKLQYCSPASYFVEGHVWESLEPPPYTPPTFTTDISSVSEPMDAVFDEVWCPLLAEAAEREGIKARHLCYLSESAVLRSGLKHKGGL